MSINEIGQKPAYSVYEERDQLRELRELCGELLFIANNSFDVYKDILEKSGCGRIFDQSGKQIDLTEILKQLHFSKQTITKAEKALGGNNGTTN